MTEDQFKKYLEYIVKIKVNKNAEVPYEYGTFIAYLKYDNIVKHYVLNHPYDIDKKHVVCGEANFDYGDVEFIKYVTLSETLIWYDAYKEFHMHWLKTNGRDECAVTIEVDTALK